MRATPHPRQQQRLEALRGFEILDTPREQDFDDITRLVSEACDVPISVINFIDAERQWFKSEVGLGVRETPLDTSICSHVILEHDFVEINDTLSDQRMSDNPLCAGSQGFRFYAGALLKTADGLPLGTLCVLDYSPRALTDLQRTTVQVLAKQVMKQLELRRALKLQNALRREIDHRVTNSLATVSSLIRLQKRHMKDPSLGDAMMAIENRISTIALLHRELCQSETAEVIGLRPFMQRIESLQQKAAPAKVNVEFEFVDVLVSSLQASSIAMIVNEFISNSFKHAFPDNRAGKISVRGTVDSERRYTISCSDDGIGKQGDAAETGHHGLGMMIIRASADQLGGMCNSELTKDGFRLVVNFMIQDNHTGGHNVE